MQTISIALDDDLLRTLQANSDAQKMSQAELIRHALQFYFRVHEEAEIRQQYQSGYGNAELTELALEMKDWEDEQVWPEQ